ncbi:unnamed protein product [Adineta ricciae]|uniref:EGF-like domain-containing protein n=1 Tax=Adineta ricciae TaxID=249248 RepID=A0A815MVY1_ADIRI|nr:unnamed protein product [Adineta ricciae]
MTQSYPYQIAAFQYHDSVETFVNPIANIKSDVDFHLEVFISTRNYRTRSIMLFLKSAIVLLVTLLATVRGQNQCTAAAQATCGAYPCVQTAQCTGGVVITTTQSPVVIPNQCANAVCPAGATCIPTNQNPALYICLCPNNIIANPDCPVNPLPNNPCLTNNPCLNGGTCVVNQLTLQAVCVCPPGTYGNNCSYSCRPACDSNWCYNGGRCVNAYGQAYCSCGQNYRGRRCELRHDRRNYVYLYHNPRW